MEGQQFDDVWANVDSSADPASCIHFLDDLNATESYQAYKRRSFALLDTQEGQRIIEVGCGAGDEARALAQMVGRTGQVIGIDNSETMIAEARKRTEGYDWPVEFHLGDVYCLDFADNTFDGCRADRILLHVTDPQRALAEMVRVVRPRGRIVVSEIDWGTHIIDTGNRSVTRRVLDTFCDRQIRNAWVGRQLPGLFKLFGLIDIIVGADALIFTDYNQRLSVLQELVQCAIQTGVLSTSEAADWLDDLDQHGQSGRFFEAVVIFSASGRKSL